jgi:hypothetical protein
MPIEEHRKTVYERLDTLWEFLENQDFDGDSASQEFLALLTDLASGSRDEKMWDMVKTWARKRS